MVWFMFDGNESPPSLKVDLRGIALLGTLRGFWEGGRLCTCTVEYNKAQQLAEIKKTPLLKN